MTKKNSNNDPLDLFPIPNDAIYINSKKNLNPRDKIISALKKYLKDNPDWVSELSAPKIGEAGILSGTNSRKHATGFRDVLERVKTKNSGSKINTEVF